MNGRVYDPILGRFLTPDPLVQAPTLSQSWNRYSYVWNNPLRNTDPSGYKTSSTTSTEYAQEVQRNGKQADVDVVEAGPNGSTTITKGGAGIKTIQKKGSENTGTKTESREEYQNRMRYQMNCGCLTKGPDSGNDNGGDKSQASNAVAADAASPGVVGGTGDPEDVGKLFTSFTRLITKLTGIFSVLSLKGSSAQGDYVFHHTNAAGAAGIPLSGEYRPSADGLVYFSPVPYTKGSNAKEKLSLTTTPTGYFPVLKSRIPGLVLKGTVEPDNGQPGGGIEYVAPGPVPYNGEPFIPIGP